MSLSNTGVLQSLNFSEVGITDGLIGWWPLNGTAKDLSGNANNGTVSGATVASGLNGLCYSFDGSTALIQTSSPIISGIMNFSISAWINRSATGSIDYIAGNYGLSPYNAGVEFAVSNSNKLFLYFGSYVNGIASLSSSTWYHVIATRQGNTVTLYANGVVDNSGTLTASISGSNFCIGNGPNYTTEALAGLIEDVRIYNRALTADEVNILYELGNTANKVKQSKNTIYIKGEFNESL